jgi:hypothetical protein
VLWYNLIQNGLEQGAYIYKRPGFYVYTLRFVVYDSVDSLAYVIEYKRRGIVA